MNRIKLLLIGALVALPVLGWAVAAHAQSFRSSDHVTVLTNQTVNSSLYASGRNVDIAGTVNGDIFCAAQNVSISGTVHGDVFCVGQDIHVTGKVDGNVRAAGQNVSISADISRNLSVAGQNISTDSRSTVGGDASFAGQDITINGQVGRDIAASSGTVTINTQVGRSVTAVVSQLNLGSQANVKGNIEYTSENNIHRDSGAQIAGKTTHKQPAKNNNTKVYHLAPWVALFFFLSMLLIALVLVLLVPNVFEAAASNALASLGITFLVGIASSILVPVLIVALMFTVVGIPLALLLGLIWGLFLFLAGPFAAYLLGRLILQRRATNAILTMLAGAVVLLLLYAVPFLGFFIALLALWFGLGMILRGLRIEKPRYKIVPSKSVTKVTVK